MYPLSEEVTRASGTVAETKWIGAAFNLFLYMLHSYVKSFALFSHTCIVFFVITRIVTVLIMMVFGAFWYVSAVEKKNKCWRQVCAKILGCNLKNQYCTRGGVDNSLHVH